MLQAKIVEWFNRYGNQVFLIFSFVLVGVLSFEAGYLMNISGQMSPITIRVPEIASESQLPQKMEVGGKSLQRTSESTLTIESKDAKNNCSFVGSKNSNKYHTPSSRCAKQIKAENLVCFQSSDDAQKKGYQAGCLE